MLGSLRAALFHPALQNVEVCIQLCWSKDLLQSGKRSGLFWGGTWLLFSQACCRIREGRTVPYKCSCVPTIHKRIGWAAPVQTLVLRLPQGGQTPAVVPVGPRALPILLWLYTSLGQCPWAELALCDSSCCADHHGAWAFTLKGKFSNIQ